MFVWPSQDSEGFERCVAQYKCFGMTAVCVISQRQASKVKIPYVVFGCIAQYKCFGDDRKVFSCSGSNASTETSVTFVNRYQDASMPHQMAGVRAENSGVREVSLSFDVSATTNKIQRHLRD